MFIEYHLKLEIPPAFGGRREHVFEILTYDRLQGRTNKRAFL